MGYSTTICKSVDIIPIRFSAKTVHSSRATRPLRCNQRHCYRVCVALGQLIMTSLTKQFTAPQILSLIKLEKLGTNVYFINSLTRLPQRHCDKKASIETRLGTIYHCDITIASDRFMYRWHHERSTAVYNLKSSEWWRNKNWGVGIDTKFSIQCEDIFIHKEKHRIDFILYVFMTRFLWNAGHHACLACLKLQMIILWPGKSWDYNYELISSLWNGSQVHLPIPSVVRFTGSGSLVWLPQRRSINRENMGK